MIRHTAMDSKGGLLAISYGESAPMYWADAGWTITSEVVDDLPPSTGQEQVVSLTDDQIWGEDKFE